ESHFCRIKPLVKRKIEIDIIKVQMVRVDPIFLKYLFMFLCRIQNSLVNSFHNKNFLPRLNSILADITLRLSQKTSYGERMFFAFTPFYTISVSRYVIRHKA